MVDWEIEPPTSVGADIICGAAGIILGVAMGAQFPPTPVMSFIFALLFGSGGWLFGRMVLDPQEDKNVRRAPPIKKAAADCDSACDLNTKRIYSRKVHLRAKACVYALVAGIFASLAGSLLESSKLSGVAAVFIALSAIMLVSWVEQAKHERQSG